MFHPVSWATSYIPASSPVVTSTPSTMPSHIKPKYTFPILSYITFTFSTSKLYLRTSPLVEYFRLFSPLPSHLCLVPQYSTLPYSVYFLRYHARSIPPRAFSPVPCSIPPITVLFVATFYPRWQGEASWGSPSIKYYTIKTEYGGKSKSGRRNTVYAGRIGE